MELTHADLVGFRTRWETMFNQAFALAEPQIEKIALQVNSGRVEQVVHRWMAGIPGMREFTDTRVINNLETNGQTVRNRKWEDTVAIKREDLERDQYGVYDPMVARLGQIAKLHRDELGFGLLSDMLTDPTITAYDGIAFYGNHNANRKVSFNNVSAANLAEPALATAIQELRKRRDRFGNPLAAAQSRPLLIIPPDLEFTARKLQNLSFIVTTRPGTAAPTGADVAAGAENVLQGAFDIVISPYLKTAKEWHLTLVDRICKPVIWQLEQEIEMYGWDKFLFQWSMHDEYVLGARGLYAVGPGLPEMAYGSTGT